MMDFAVVYLNDCTKKKKKIYKKNNFCFEFLKKQAKINKIIFI